MPVSYTHLDVYKRQVQGATEAVMTNLDVLGYLDQIPVCTAYEVDGKTITDFPSTPTLMRCKPVSTLLPGWPCDVRGDVYQRQQEYPSGRCWYACACCATGGLSDWRRPWFAG